MKIPEKLFRTNIYKGKKEENPIFLHHYWIFIKIFPGSHWGIVREMNDLATSRRGIQQRFLFKSRSQATGYETHWWEPS